MKKIFKKIAKIIAILLIVVLALMIIIPMFFSDKILNYGCQLAKDYINADLYVKMSEFYQAIGKYEDAFAYIKEASDIDKSAKNQELYMQLANILRRKGISEQ